MPAIVTCVSLSRINVPVRAPVAKPGVPTTVKALKAGLAAKTASVRVITSVSAPASELNAADVNPVGAVTVLAATVTEVACVVWAAAAMVIV
jgi:hypothetical protein